MRKSIVPGLVALIPMRDHFEPEDNRAAVASLRDNTGLANQEESMSRALISTLALWMALAASGCGRPADPICMDACTAQNACPGRMQTDCGGVCGAVPQGCEMETPAFWNCADAHKSEACQSFPSCSAEFAKYALCVELVCALRPFDSSCYYVSH
jgi:hypothetical protein